jgi:hypothetical protein
MRSHGSLVDDHAGRSLSFTLGVIRRSFVWTIVVAVSAVSLVIAGGAHADSAKPAGDLSTMVAQSAGE